MAESRVVVTGLGAVTPIGVGVDAFWSGLLDSRNGVAEITRFDATGYRCNLAAEVKEFQPANWMDRKLAARMDRFCHFAMASTRMAFTDANLGLSSFEPTRAGVIIGSGIGGSKGIEDAYSVLDARGPRGVSPFAVSLFLINMAACQVSIEFGLRGPLSAPSVACSTGAGAIGDAYRVLQRGDADLMVSGAAEACLDAMPYGAFCATRSMTACRDPAVACRPFDLHRDGFVMGEGAGIAIMETLDHAMRRGAPIRAEIVGFGNTADAFHLTAPHPQGDGMIRVMEAAVADAGVERRRVGYINAHGTSTPLNDKCESAAISSVFGDHAATLKVSSNKSMIGHLMAASGAVEFVSTVKSVESGIAPPTINYRESDPDCPLDYVVEGAEAFGGDVALTNSFGFGGGNVCLAVQRFGESDEPAKTENR